MFKKILTTLSGLSIGIGCLLVLGTAGASDFNNIDFINIFVQCCIGVFLVWIGFRGLKTTNPNLFN